MQAIKIENIENKMRLLVFEINEDSGDAYILDIVEADWNEAFYLVQYLQDNYPDINAVRVDANQEGAVAVGNSYVCIPDCLGVFELAEILASQVENEN